MGELRQFPSNKSNGGFKGSSRLHTEPLTSGANALQPHAASDAGHIDPGFQAAANAQARRSQFKVINGGNDQTASPNNAPTETASNSSPSGQPQTGSPSTLSGSSGSRLAGQRPAGAKPSANSNPMGAGNQASAGPKTGATPKTDISSHTSDGQPKFGLTADERAQNPRAAKKLDKVANEPLGGMPLAGGAGAGGLKGGASRIGSGFSSYMKKHPRGALYAVIAVVMSLLSIAIWMLSIPFQLIHMGEQLLSELKPSENIEQKGERKLMSKVFAARAQAAAPEQAGEFKATGHPISDLIDNMRIKRFNNLLAKDNLAMEFDTSGRLVGIKDTISGERTTDFSESTFQERRVGIGKIVAERIAPWRVLKRVNYTKLMRFHARVSWSFWPKEKVNDVKKLLVEKIFKGASPNEVAAAEGKTNKDGTQAAPDDSAVGGSESAEAVIDEFAKSGDKASAIKVGIKAFSEKFGTALGISGIIAMVCTVDKMINDAAEKGYLTRAMQLVRNGNAVLTMASQLRSGKNLDIDELGSLMSQFNGDSKAQAHSNDSKGWDQSAAYRRINGLPVVTDIKSESYNPDLNPASHPDGFFLNQVNDVLQTIMSYIPGANFVCDAANSAIGTAVLFVGGFLEVAGNLLDGEVLETLATGAKLAIQYMLTEKVLPWALSAATGLAITGTENAVDFFNNADAGAIISAADYARSYGGRRLNNSEQKQLVDDTNRINAQIAKDKGFGYQMLSLANPDSVLSKVVDKVPTSPSTAVADIMNLPVNALKMVGSIFGGQTVQAALGTDTVNPYSFALYGFTEAEIDKYDPIENEAYLTTKLPGSDKTRLEILGDPTNYSPNDENDQDTTDLMHCFVNDFATPTDLKNDPICGKLGLGVVTERDDDTAQYNDQGDDVVSQIYKDHGFNNLSIDDDFLRYRIQMFYTHGILGLQCASDDSDCFKGAGTTAAATTNSGPWKSGASCIGIADGEFATWRGSALGIAGTWNDNAASTQEAQASIGGEYGKWTASLDNAVGGFYDGESWSSVAGDLSDSSAYWKRIITALDNINAGWGQKQTIYLRYAHEFNGDWYKWKVSSGDTANFIKASGHFYDLVQTHLVAKGRDAKVVYAPNSDSHNGVTAEQSWPGDNKVDVVGVDWYNWVNPFNINSDATFQSHLMDGSIDDPLGIGQWAAFAAKHGKPLAFPEWGQGGDGPNDNPGFISAFNTWMKANAGTGPGKLLYEVYFNCEWDKNMFQIYPATNALPQTSAMYKSLKWGAAANGIAASDFNNPGPDTSQYAAGDSSNDPASQTSTKHPWWDVAGLMNDWAGSIIRRETQDIPDL